MENFLDRNSICGFISKTIRNWNISATKDYGQWKVRSRAKVMCEKVHGEPKFDIYKGNAVCLVGLYYYNLIKRWTMISAVYYEGDWKQRKNPSWKRQTTKLLRFICRCPERAKLRSFVPSAVKLGIARDKNIQPVQHLVVNLDKMEWKTASGRWKRSPQMLIHTWESYKFTPRMTQSLYRNVIRFILTYT